MNNATTAWRDAQRLLVTRLSGVFSAAEIHAWRDGLYALARALGPTGTFRTLVDIRGYEVADQDLAVHKVQREVIPVFLAEHGFAVGFFDLYEKTPPPMRSGAPRCIAVAHVHHDRDKMDRYNELLGNERERFFTDPAAAERWLEHAGAAPRCAP